jgi:signal transduction histidine kinase
MGAGEDMAFRRAAGGIADDARRGWYRLRRGGTTTIQSKITLFIVTVVVSVLSITTYASRILVEEKAEQLLKERYILIVRQIDASIVSMDELHDGDALVEEMDKLFQVRPNIVAISLYELTPDGINMTAQKTKNPDARIGQVSDEEIQAIRRGEVVAELETDGQDRAWHIAAPIRIKRDVAGLIKARISTKEFDALVAYERGQAVLLTGIAALAILVFLVWLLRRTISKPIQALVGAMARAEAGDLRGQVGIRSRDEVGRLAEQFNRMLTRIQENAVRIRQFNEELQHKVSDATGELNRRYEELQSMNRQLAQAQLQVAHSERLAAAGQVAASVAHQIGTPLHSIMGHLHRLRRDQTDDAREDRVRIIESQVERVVQTIRELLDTVRKPAPRMEHVDVNGVLSDLFQLVMPSLSLRGITLRTQFAPRLPSTLGDAGQLQEALLNLLINAIDAMPNGGELTVTTTAEDGIGEETGMICVMITDTGCGINDADLPKIFEPFFTTKSDGKGTGLGLSIAQETVSAHHGRIEVASQGGVGTRFTVTLPVLSVTSDATR